MTIDIRTRLNEYGTKQVEAVSVAGPGRRFAQSLREERAARAALLRFAAQVEELVGDERWAVSVDRDRVWIEGYDGSDEEAERALAVMRRAGEIIFAEALARLTDDEPAPAPRRARRAS